MDPKARKIRNIIIKSIAIVLLITIAGEVWLTCDYSSIDETRKADVAIILGAAIEGDRPSPVFEERIKHGIWLYQNGYVGKLIFTGGVGKGDEYSEAMVAQAYAMKVGISQKDIFIEEKSHITYDNLKYATEIVKEHNMKEVLIVSDPLHMRRAMLMAKDCGLDAYTSPTKTTKYTTLRSQIPFVMRETFMHMGYETYNAFTN